MNPGTDHLRSQPDRQASLAVVFAVLAWSLSSGSFAAAVRVQQFSLPANGLRELRIRADEGELTITGNKDIAEIRVRATIRVRPSLSEQEFSDFLDKWVRLTLDRHGRSAELDSTISAMSIADFGARIDLVVEMPSAWDLVVIDGKGVLNISGLQSDVEVTDGSGKLFITDIRGDVQIQDRTGSINAEKIDGTLFLNKRSGSVSIDGLSGDLVIEAELRGELEIRDHTGKVVRPE